MAIWTQHDEAKLQREIEQAELWQRVLDKSATSPMRSGHQGHTECRQLITRSQRIIADLTARKNASQVAA